MGMRQKIAGALMWSIALGATAQQIQVSKENRTIAISTSG